MRFDGLKIHGIGPFKDVDLDISAIAGKLVAVVGENGAGKSTMLELLAGALFRETPTRGTLIELATTRDAFVEVRAVNGAAYTIRQSVDSVSGKGEALVLDASGLPVLETTKVRDMDAWTERHIVSPAVLYASAFSPQRMGKPRSLVEIPAVDRKRVLLRVLQVERLEAMAERARENARVAKAEVETLRARLSDARDRLPDLTSAQEMHAQALATQASAEQALADARVALERATAAAADVTRRRELAEQRRRCANRFRELQDKKRADDEKIRNNRMLLERSDEIAAAVQRSREIDAASTELQAELGKAREKLAGHKTVADNHRRNAQQCRSRMLAAEGRAKAASARLRDREAIEAAVASLPGLAERLEQLDSEIANTEVSVTELDRGLLTHKDQRIDGLREGLVFIRDGGDALASTAVLARDDIAANAAERAPAAITELRAKLAELRKDRGVVTEARRQAEQLAARAGDLEAAARELENAEADRKRECLDEEAQLTAAEAADIDGREYSRQEQHAQSRLTELQNEIKQKDLVQLVTWQPKLEQATARLEVLEPQFTKTSADLDACKAELDTLPDVQADDVDLGTFERVVRECTQLDTNARAAAGQAALEIKAAEEGLVFLGQLEGELAGTEQCLEDWTRLGQDLGKDGLQALEIDAAVPELNTLANTLLHECFGSRFTIEVRTDRLSGDGKRMLEDLDIRVLDTEHGRDAEIETYSGGERVILGEALSLALSVIACRRAGMQDGVSLVRDESGAALDPANGRAWIRMLRRAADFVNASHVLFVTHSAELAEMADARIRVKGGAVYVE